MDSQQFLTYLKSPKELNKDSIGKINDLLKEYPYCQSLQLLLTKNLQLENHQLYHHQLKIAAAYVSERKVLFNLVKPKESIVDVKNISIEEKPIETIVIELPIPIKEEKKDIVEVEIETPVFENKYELQEKEIVATLVVEEKKDIEPVNEIKAEKVPINNDEVVVEKEIIEEKAAEIKVVSTPIILEEIKSEVISELIVEVQKEEEKVAPLIEKKEISKEEKYQQLQAELKKRLAEIAAERGEKIPVSNTIPEKVEDKKEEIVVSKVEEVKIELEKPKISAKKEKKNVNDLIENFIVNQPRIKAKRVPDNHPIVDLAQKSAIDKEEIVSETLGKIYLKQGNFQKAIKTYEKLSLKFPEKSSYFAAQIENIKKGIN
jgi:tetratricopeptide (TPR) repeat protein